MKNIFLFLFITFVLFSCSQKNTDDNYAPLFPFLISYDGSDNVTNMSHLLDAPAGKHGFVRVENGRFVTDAGPIRFHGTNLTGPANFPEYEDAERLADRLARFGINCVRLHYIDADYGNFLNEKQRGIFMDDSTTQRNLDPDQLNKLDYLVAQLKERGIYVNMNLHVGRKLDERDGFTGYDQRPHLDKGVDNFEPRMIELQKEYARDLLTHVNPYTGLSYIDDPCVAMVEINNENGLLHRYHRGDIDLLPEPYSGELRDQWNRWLNKKYPSRESLINAWNWQEDLSDNQTGEEVPFPTIRLDDSTTLGAKRDFYQFLFDTESNYWTGMSKYLKEEIGVKSVIAGTQLGFSSPFIQGELDYTCEHAYWCHPSIREDWRIRNESVVNSMTTIKRLSAQRINGKPYIIGEYNHPFPNQYGAEGQPLLRSYGALQGWDGVFEYTFNHRQEYDLNYNNYFFSINDRTDVLAHLPACAAIYLRGDVKEAKDSMNASVDFASYFEKLVSDRSLGANISFADFDTNLSLVHRAGITLNGDDIDNTKQDNLIGKIIKSDTKELTWNREIADKGYFTVNTPNSKLFTGFPEGREISLGDIDLNIGDTRLGWTTVSLVSQNATGFGNTGEPSNILLTATGVTENKGMKIKKLDEKHITLTDWGRAPVYTEGIPLTITLPSDPEKTKCFALDPEGQRKQEVPITAFEGRTKIVLEPDYKTIWYEIEIK